MAKSKNRYERLRSQLLRQDREGGIAARMEDRDEKVHVLTDDEVTQLEDKLNASS